MSNEDEAWDADRAARARQRVDDLLKASPSYYQRNILKDMSRCAGLMKTNRNRFKDAVGHVMSKLGIHGDDSSLTMLCHLLVLEYLDAYYSEQGGQAE